MSEITIKIQPGTFAVEVSGTKDYVEGKVEELIKKYGPSYSSQPKVPASAPVTAGKKQSASEFIKRLNVKSQADRVIALGFYLEKQRGQQDYTTSDLAEVNREAKQPAFTNIIDWLENEHKKVFEPASF